MSLNWNVGKCANSDALYVRGEYTPMGSFIPYEDQTQPATGKTKEALDLCTHQLIFSMMVIGIGTITKANYPEVYARLHFFELVRGAQRTQGNGDAPSTAVYFTLAEVKRRIGLTTNVSTLSDAAFIKLVWRNHHSDAMSHVRYEEEIVEVAEAVRA